MKIYRNEQLLHSSLLFKISMFILTIYKVEIGLHIKEWIPFLGHNDSRFLEYY